MAKDLTTRFVISNQIQKVAQSNSKQRIHVWAESYNNEEQKQAFSDGLIFGNEDGYQSACNDLIKHLAILANENPKITVSEAIKTIFWNK